MDKVKNKRSFTIIPLTDLIIGDDKRLVLIPCYSNVIVRETEGTEVVGNYCYICGKDLWQHIIKNYKY